MRVFLILVLLASRVSAAPLASLDADLDGNAGHLELDATGHLEIETKNGATTIAIGSPITRAKLATAQLKGATVIVIDATSAAGDEVIVLGGPSWKPIVREAVGGVGLDRDYATAIDVQPEGIYKYQTRAGFQRCDGKPAYLFAEGWTGTAFRKVSRIPTNIPDTAPIVAARIDHAPAEPPLLYQAKLASSEPGAQDAGALGIPQELDDGKPATYWHEELAGSDGAGQFFTFEPRFGGAKAAQLRIVPGNPASAATIKAFNRPRRIAIVGAQGAWRIDLPDAANDPLGTAYVADLPAPVDGCVSVVLESTYGSPTGTTAIAELEVFADGERSGGGEALLAHVVAEGKDGAKSAARGLARRGAIGAAAIDAELAKADANARGRLVHALVAIRDPAAGPILARAAGQGWIRGAALVEVIDALGALGQTQELHDLAAKPIDVDARIAAVHALGTAGAKELVDIAGQGPRALRHAVIDGLTGVAVATLAAAAQAASSPSAAGDLWRATTRRAHAVPGDRAAALAAMTAALPTATDYERRYRLIDGIAAIGDGPALAALATLLRGLPAGADKGAFEAIAARAIAANPRPEALELIVALARDTDPGVRLAALSAIEGSDGGTTGPWHAADGPDGLDRVIETALSTDPWPDVRRRAAQVLGGRCERAGPARALDASVGRDRDLGVRSDALAGLVECKAAGTGELLARTWDDAKAPLVLRQRAVDLSVGLGDRALAAKLVGKLSSWRGAAMTSAEALALAENAAYAVGRLSPPGAGDALLAAMADGSFPEIVAAAATGLGLMGPACPPAAKAKLRELAQSEDQQIQPAAFRAAAQCGNVSRD